MNKIIKTTYGVMVLLMLLLVVISVDRAKIEFVQPGWQDGFSQIENYSFNMVKQSSSPTGYTRIYHFKLNDISDDYNYLYIYTEHQYVKLFIDGECVYQLGKLQDNLRWKSTGSVWNQIPLTPDHDVKNATLELQAIYKSEDKSHPRILVGTKYDIVRYIINSNLSNILIGLFALLIGILIFGLTILLNYRGVQRTERMMTGVLSILIGIWDISITDFTGLMAINYPVLSVIRYGVVMLFPVPFAYSLMLALNDHENKLYQFPCVISMINVVLVMTSEFLAMADIRQTLWITLSSLLITGLFCTVIVFINIKKQGRNKGNKVAMFGCIAFHMCLLLLIRGRCNDLLANIIMLVPFIYLLLLGQETVSNLRNLLRYGMEARKFEKIAYFDQLTGLYNRTALAEYGNNEDFNPESAAVAVFDINNLKKYNDCYGHEKGDWYIKECSGIILECFGDIGLCYRTGGDEFLALFENVKDNVIPERMKIMEKKVEAFNKDAENLIMGIAWGYAFFDKEQDDDIDDTTKRADLMMYQCKYEMKQRKNNR